MKELQECRKNEENDFNLLKNELKKNLNLVAEQWSEEVLIKIKEDIKEKAIVGKYNIVNGKRAILCDCSVPPFVYKIGTGLIIKKQNIELEETLSKFRAKAFSTEGLCYSSGKFIDHDYCNFFDISAKWTSKVSRRLSLGQKILSFITFGIFYLFVLFGGIEYDSYAEQRIYEGTIQFDYLFRKTCSLIKEKLKNEGITFNGFILQEIYPKVLLQDINGDIPIKLVDTKAYKDRYKKGAVYSRSIPLKISCTAVFN